MYIYISLYSCLYIYLCLLVYIYICIYIYIFVWVGGWRYVLIIFECIYIFHYIHVYIYTYVYLCIYIHVYIHKYVYIHIHTHTHMCVYTPLVNPRCSFTESKKHSPNTGARVNNNLQVTSIHRRCIYKGDTSSHAQGTDPRVALGA